VRLGPNKWPLVATIKALFADARRRSSEYSEAKARFERLKAERERLKLMKEGGEVCYTRELDEFGLAVYAAHVKFYGPLAARIGGRDLALRRLAQKELDIAQQGLSDEMKRLGDAIKDKEP
jgi:hypothetical protein